MEKGRRRGEREEIKGRRRGLYIHCIVTMSLCLCSDVKNN